jgi:hypothetical protein
LRGLVLRELGLGRDVVVDERQRATRGASRGYDMPGRELKPRQQGLDIGHVLGHAAPGADRALHVADRARQVAVQLA